MAAGARRYNHWRGDLGAPGNCLARVRKPGEQRRSQKQGRYEGGLSSLPLQLGASSWDTRSTIASGRWGAPRRPEPGAPAPTTAHQKPFRQWGAPSGEELRGAVAATPAWSPGAGHLPLPSAGPFCCCCCCCGCCCCCCGCCCCCLKRKEKEKVSFPAEAPQEKGIAKASRLLHRLCMYTCPESPFLLQACTLLGETEFSPSTYSKMSLCMSFGRCSCGALPIHPGALHFNQYPHKV